MMNSMVKKAIRFGEEKHKGQSRYQNYPYFIHCKRVAKIVGEYTKDANLITAAYLHDTLEDTKTSYAELRRQFNQSVADLVLELTNDEKKIEEMNRARYMLQKFNTISVDAFLIKLADRLDNVSEVSNFKDEFFQRYVYETDYLMRNLNRELNGSHMDLVKKIKGAVARYL